MPVCCLKFNSNYHLGCFCTVRTNWGVQFFLAAVFLCVYNLFIINHDFKFLPYASSLPFYIAHRNGSARLSYNITEYHIGGDLFEQKQIREKYVCDPGSRSGADRREH